MPGTMMPIIMNNFYIIETSSETYNQQHNLCSGYIRDLQYWSKLQIIKSNNPDPLWDFWIVAGSDIISSLYTGRQRPFLEVLICDSVDISKYIDFELYDLIWYWDNLDSIGNPCIGRWLGVYHRVGSALWY